ncbi:MAG: DsbA family oxidoreductase [Alteraurantiacibacter sp.]
MLAIDIWSDIMCPWCAVGYARLQKALELLDGEIAATIRWMPFELDPTTPPQGTPKLERLQTVYGRTPEEAEAMAQHMLGTAREAGFPLDYEGEEDRPSMMWNTLDAHKLLRWALLSRGPEVQTALKLALFEAHFRQRRKISDRVVLCEIAGGIDGLSSEGAAQALTDPVLETAVRAEQQQARGAGLSSVPTFVVASKFAIQGAQEPEALADALRQIAQHETAT